MTAAGASRDFLGHPRGLTYLVMTEGFERFSYYGMQSLLVLYIAGRLLTPGVEGNILGFAGFRHILELGFGRLPSSALATLIFGLYGGSVYASPILGSLIGDRLGRRRIVIVGLVAMAFGHFMMAFEQLFLFAMAALTMGSGLLKGNLAAQVRGLYGPTDQRLDQAYSIFYMAINIGGALAPFLCGALGELYGWKYGFTAAGVVMVIGLCIYLSGQRYLPVNQAALPKAETRDRPRYHPAQLVGIAVMLLVATLFWTTASQGWNAYNLWVRDRVDRSVFGFTVPVTWFQMDSSVAAIALAPAVIWLWRWQGSHGKEPEDLLKLAWGCLTLAGATLIFSLAEVVAGSAKIPVLWPLAYDWLGAIGYLYVAPVFVAWFSRIAPTGATGTVIAIYYLAIGGGSFLSGWLGRFYGVVSNAEFWGIQAAIAACGGLLLLAVGPPLVRALDRRRTAPANARSRRLRAS
jgi:proton-dependent oligopeptide transporter, POT family